MEGIPIVLLPAPDKTKLVVLDDWTPLTSGTYVRTGGLPSDSRKFKQLYTDSSSSIRIQAALYGFKQLKQFLRDQSTAGITILEISILSKLKYWNTHSPDDN